jgi:hypothetical protein
MEPFCFILVEKIFIDQKIIVYRQIIKGIFWTNFWLDSNFDRTSEKKEYLANNPETVLDSKSIICHGILNILMLMLTFGLCSPFVAFAMTCVVVLRMNIWIILIGRFTCLVSAGNNENNTHYALVALSRVYISFVEVCKRSFWLLAWCSSLFFALICWDVAVAGGVSWINSIWIPISIIMYPLFLWVMAHCFLQRNIDDRRRNDYHLEIVNKKTETQLLQSSASENMK